MALDIAWIPVLVGTLGYQILGALWYGPLFGRPWMDAMGYESAEDMAGENPNIGYALTALGSLIAAITLAVLVDWTSATTWQQGALVGAVVGVGIAGTTSLQAVPFEGRPATVYVINVAYNVLALTGIGAALGVWG